MRSNVTSKRAEYGYATSIFSTAKAGVATVPARTEQDARAWLERHVVQMTNQKIQYDEMTPEQQQNMAKDRRIADLEAKQRTFEEESAAAEEDRVSQETFQRTQNEITTAITALGYEADDGIVGEVAVKLDEVHLAGHTHVTASMVAKVVLKELEEKAASNWGEFDPEKAPPEVLEKFGKYQAAKLKAEQKPAASRSPQEPQSTGKRRSRRVAGLV